MAPSQTLLIVEDEPSVARGLKDAFEFRGFAVDVAVDGVEALDLCSERRYQAIILDIMLPKVSGFEVMERLRARGDTVPTIMLTARGEEEDRVRGLMAGADDYVVKPFSITELVARVEANLRRREMDLGPPDVLRFDEVEVDLERHSVVRAGRREEPPGCPIWSHLHTRPRPPRQPPATPAAPRRLRAPVSCVTPPCAPPRAMYPGFPIWNWAPRRRLSSQPFAAVLHYPGWNPAQAS